MLIALRPLLIAATLIIASNTVSFAEDGFSTPQKLLNDIYSRYGKDYPASRLDYADQKVIEKYFTPEIAAKMIADNAKAAAAGEVPTLDGDPFVDAQEIEITELVIEDVKQITPDAAIGYVIFKNVGTPRKAELFLQKTDKGWQITDIISVRHDKLSDIYRP